MLDLAKESWEQQPSPHCMIIQHVEQMHDRMASVWPVVREHMQQAKVYSRGAKLSEFQPGENVLVLIPSNECKFLARWLGPYEIVKRNGPGQLQSTPTQPKGGPANLPHKPPEAIA
ncbi:hypothetical protein QQF64_011235 [Cirrhinus molitorella]|uniref:Uncharacterized protein n=1 Tax=Cirrhinus molitorella TaxID=172907 RepID=A0ABR3LYP0_9TELE